MKAGISRLDRSTKVHPSWQLTELNVFDFNQLSLLT